MNKTDVVPVMDQDDEAIDLVGLLKSVWRGKWLILACMLVAVFVGSFYAWRVVTPKYVATATLVLDVNQQQVVDLGSVIGGSSNTNLAMNTEMVVLSSRRVLERVVNELKLNLDPEFNAALREVPRYSLSNITARLRGLVYGVQPSVDVDPTDEQSINGAVAALRSKVDADFLPATYVFRIQVTTESPNKSKQIVNSVAEAYIADQVNVKFETTDNATAWLSARVVELEGEIAERQDAIKQMRANMQLVTPEGLELLNQRVRDLRDRMERGQESLKASRDRLPLLEEARDSGDPQRIAAAFNDPILTRLANQSGGGDDNARDTLLSRADSLLTAVRNEITRLEPQVNSLETSLVAAEAEMDGEYDKLVRVQQAERELQGTQTLYDTFVTRLKETSLQRGLQQADSRVLSPATGGRLVEPNKPRILMMAAILGGISAVALILARQYLHSGFRTSEELESKTGVPVIGQIPSLKIRKRKELLPFLLDNPTSAAVEAYRNLRTSILMSSLDRPPQIILSTSSVPGEGKTTNALALAQNFAGLRKRVLLIEGDIRRQTLYEYFDFKRGSTKGLLSALEGQAPLADIVVQDEKLGIDLLFGQKSSANAADVFSSATFQEFLETLRGYYDHIIIDTPPVLVVPDARVLGRYADAVIFTVAWNKTNRNQLSEAIRQLVSVNVPITGLILSQIDAAGMRRYGYGDRYGAYSGYGKAYYDG